MQIIAPDILAEACRLSVGLTLLTLAVGLFLWLFGYRSHRFWIVLGATVLAGIDGLSRAPALHLSPIPTAILFGTAAGMLALSLARVATFVAAGAAGLLLAQSFTAQVPFPIYLFLSAGLVSLLFYRWWLMTVTGFCGSLLLLYAALMFTHIYSGQNMARFAEGSSVLLNLACAGMTLTSVAFQFWTSRRKGKKKAKDKDSGKKKDADKEAPADLLSRILGRAA